MADFGFARFEDDDANEEEEEEGEEWQARTLKDGLLFLLDCSKSMFERLEDGQCHFQLAIRCIKTTMQNKIISSDKDSVGVVFIGTENSDGPNKHINIYHDLGQPCASRILALEDMEETGWKNFNMLYGHDPDFSLSDALWTCADMFSKSPQNLNNKRVMLFTNNDDPHAGNTNRQIQARTKASDLANTGIDLELIHLVKSGQTFDVNKFYKDLLFTDDDELTELPDPAERLEELLTRMRTKDHKKRATRRIPLTLGEGVSLSVGVYNLVRTCAKPPMVKLSKKDNSELKSHTKTYLKDTVEVLMPQDLKKAQTYGARRICFENDEVKAIRQFDESGLKLMGFKPRSCLKPYFQVKPAQFLYPDEGSVTGSTTLFTALLRKCLDRDVVAICKYVPGKSNPPKFAALLPQDEELDEHKVQTTPPGFHVIFLPFADDFRKVKYEETPKANEDQVEAAKEVVKKLKFQFSSEMFENPVLQNHWRNIEALALDRDEPDAMIDYTMPADDKITKKAGSAIREFRDLVFPADYAPGQKKRAAPSESAAAKRAKAAETSVTLDLETEARAGRLGKLTVAVLKEAARNANIPCLATRKADIIDAISDHYNVE
ncbi:X-ray repair cross-complementing protein 5-like isoform X2 [Littorina saxatilis]|uniref:X-ray repair cross-complementing protein 5-like isoform X2 n=1 Tax=Littorina saxatilis TaxID=31220 RepID=UPI0038B60BE0